jgi:hypothetical protein
MFEKKEKQNVSVPVDVAVQSMPKEFYGGANPVVVFKDFKKEVVLNKPGALSAQEKRSLDRATVVGSNQTRHLSQLLTSSKFLLLSGLVFFVLFVGGAGIYYWWTLRQPTGMAAYPPPALTVVEPSIPSTTEPVGAVEPTSTLSEINTNDTKNILEFPTKSLVDSADRDNDGLTDLTEQLFNTNQALPDSDGDSYSDAHEIFYLYNPAGAEPMKLLDAGTVKEYINPIFGYSLYSPISWAIGNTGEDYRDVLFSAASGDSIEVLVAEKEASQDFSAWLFQNAPSEQFSDYQSFVSRFGAIGLERTDKLVYFFVEPTRVYVLAYHAPAINLVNYRLVLSMMARSFRLSGVSAIMIPEAPSLIPSAITSTIPALTSTSSPAATSTMTTSIR